MLAPYVRCDVFSDIYDRYVKCRRDVKYRIANKEYADGEHIKYDFGDFVFSWWPQVVKWHDHVVDSFYLGGLLFKREMRKNSPSEVFSGR